MLRVLVFPSSVAIFVFSSPLDISVVEGKSYRNRLITLSTGPVHANTHRLCMCVLFFLSVLLFGEENVPALSNNYFELWHRTQILKKSFILQRMARYFLSA